MMGMRSCDELRGYLDVKVPSASRKRGLLIQWKAWRRQWLIVRRFLVSPDPSLVSDEGMAILGRRLEVRLTGDNNTNNVSAPCPVVVVEEWQEDALVCPTQSRSHPYAFGLFPQPGCEPILFLSGRSAEESRRWLASIRSLLVPPFKPISYRLSLLSNCIGDEVSMVPTNNSPSSSSPEFTCRNICLSTKYPNVCFPPLPPLPSRCRLRRRSSVESLAVPGILMDRRRSLSDSEITTSSSEHHRHKHQRCQRSVQALDPETPKNESSLNEDYDHQHIYAGIADSGVCSSMSNDSRSYLSSSSSSSSCSSSSGLYAYATASDGGMKTYMRGNSNEYPANNASYIDSSQCKGEESSVLGGKVASSLITAGIGLMLSAPVSVDHVTDLSSLPGQVKEEDAIYDKMVDNFREQSPPEGEVDTDRRESIASGIYEEIQEDPNASNSLNAEDDSVVIDAHEADAEKQLPPPLPPRSPSQFFPLPPAKQRNLAWFLGVHRHSNSCPASDDEDDEESEENTGGQRNAVFRRTRRKISEPFGSQPIHDDSGISSGNYSRRSRKNLQSFLGVMEFSSRAKEMSKSGGTAVNKSLGSLDGKVKGGSPEPLQEWQSRGRTYTDSAGMRNSNFFAAIREAKRCNSSEAVLTKTSNSPNSIPLEVKQNRNDNDISVVMDDDVDVFDSSVDPHSVASAVIKMEPLEDASDKENRSFGNVSLTPSPNSSQDLELNETMSPITLSYMDRLGYLSNTPDTSYSSDKSDTTDKNNTQSQKSPTSIAKLLPWMKPKSALIRLLSKEQNRPQDSLSLKDKTKQVINRSLETLSRLTFSPAPMDDRGDNLTVGASSFYRSATCTGAEMQMERNNALRRVTGAIRIAGDRHSRSYESSTLGRCIDGDRYCRSYESSTMGRRRVRKKPTVSVSDDIWIRETEDKYNGQLDDLMKSKKLLKDSSLCLYHKSCLEESGDMHCHNLEAIERLAKQEMMCEKFCMAKEDEEPDYIPMGPLRQKKNADLSNNDLPSNQAGFAAGHVENRVSTVPEEDLYMSMEGIRLYKENMDQEGYAGKEYLDSVKLEESTNNLVLPGDGGDIYMSMEGRKSTLEELAQR